MTDDCEHVLLNLQISVNFDIVFIVFYVILFCSAPLSSIVCGVIQMSPCDCDYNSTSSPVYLHPNL